MKTNRVYRLAVIPGDGIGKEVVPEGVRVLERAAKKFGFELQLENFDFASCDYYEKYGRMMPEDWKEQIGKHDAIYFGAVGMPDKVPDHISLWGSLILFRREFDQYVNLRPVRLMPGVPSPLANRKPGDIDFWVVRENTEGEYSAIGGHMFPGTDREVVFQESVFTRKGVDRILEFAYELARKRPAKFRGPSSSVPPGLRAPVDPTPPPPPPPPSTPTPPGSPPAVLPPTTPAPRGSPEPDPRARDVEESKRLRDAKARAREADGAAGAGTVREVAGKSFRLGADGRWIDTAYDGKAETKKLAAYSDAWLELSRKSPRHTKWLADGERVVFVDEGVAYEVVPAP